MKRDESMVIGRGFVWGHMPKTAGDATRALFALLPHLVEHVDPHTYWKKHDPFSVREREAHVDLSTARRRILNIRRLPAWMWSYAQHERLHYGLDYDADILRAGRIARHPIRPAARRFYFSVMPRLRPVRSAQRVLNTILTKEADFRLPDDVLRRFEPEQVAFWIRQEHLIDDFIAVAKHFGEVSHDQEQALRALGYVNRTTYDHDWKQIFTPEDLERIYAANPLWAGIERAVYGGTL